MDRYVEAMIVGRLQVAKARVVRFDPESINRGRRQSEYRRRAEVKIEQERGRRRQELQDNQAAIQAALAAYRSLDAITEVRLRSAGLHIDPARALPPSLGGAPWPDGWNLTQQRAYDFQTRRPIGRLASHRGGSGLNTYLSVLYVLHAERPLPVENRHPTALRHYKKDVPWSTLAARGQGTPRAVRERMWRDLEALHRAGLVELATERGQRTIERFVPLTEDDSKRPYTIPDPGEDTIDLPESFFTNGWHLVLRPPELVMLLTVLHAYQLRKHQLAGWEEDGVPLTQHLRWEEYGVSGEAYGTVHLLAELGLVKVLDPMATRLRGKFKPPTDEEREQFEEAGHAFSPVPYQLKPVLSGFDRPAIYRLADCLSSPLPPRLAEP